MSDGERQSFLDFARECAAAGDVEAAKYLSFREAKRGRAPIDDGDALTQIHMLIASGRTRGMAIAIVARNMGAGHSITQRWRAKLRNKCS